MFYFFILNFNITICKNNHFVYLFCDILEAFNNVLSSVATNHMQSVQFNSIRF